MATRGGVREEGGGREGGRGACNWLISDGVPGLRFRGKVWGCPGYLPQHVAVNLAKDRGEFGKRWPVFSSATERHRI